MNPKDHRKDDVHDVGIGPTAPANSEQEAALPGGPGDARAMSRGSNEGDNPRNVTTMHRDEENALAFQISPEYSDRLPGSQTNIADRGGVVDGQLGPDELPDPEEVIKNREAKLKTPEHS